MSIVPRIRTITGAQIRLVTRKERAAAFARMARAWGGQLLRPVTISDGFSDDPDAHDVAIGFHTKMAFSHQYELTGLVVFRERPIQAPSIAIGKPERLFLIEALTISDSMTNWRPPVPALLAATAASLIATVHHDPDFRTHVALRIPGGDPHAEAAATMIEGRALTQRQNGASHLIPGIPDRELRFLDGKGAANSTRLVLDHIDGAITPHQPGSAQASGRTWRRQLNIEFPRALHHLSEEMRLIAAGSVDVGWALPIVANNDTGRVNVASAANN